MFLKDWLNFVFLKPRAEAVDSRSGTNGLIVVYVVFSIVKEMREQLGLEATLGYIRRYMEKIEEHDPKIKSLVYEALSDMDIEKMYKEAMS